METSVVVPAGFELRGLSSAPVSVYTVVDGLGVLLARFASVVRVKPFFEERELLMRSEVEFKDFDLLDRRGLEVPDPNPMEVPLRLKAAPSMRDMVVEHLSRFLAARAQDEGFESLEEAMDFDLEAEMDDLQTRAESSYLAAFAPHEGRADNAPGRKVDDRGPQVKTAIETTSRDDRGPQVKTAIEMTSEEPKASA